MINPIYLEKEKIKEIYASSKGCNPVKFLVWEDFIDPKIYEEIEAEIHAANIQKIDIHTDEHRTNKTALIPGSKLDELFRFFQSPTFEKYMSLYIGTQVKNEFYVDKNQISQAIWKEFEWAVTQIYEKGDFFDWHIDGPIEKGSQWAFTYYVGGYKWEWDPDNGGNLEFWMEKEPGSPEILPYYSIPYKKNTLVFIFASSIAYHRVSRMQTDDIRLSIQSTLFKK